MKIANEESKFVTDNKMKSLHEKQRPPKNTASSANILYPATNDNEIPPTPPTLPHHRRRRCYPTNGSDAILPTTPMLPPCRRRCFPPANNTNAVPLPRIAWSPTTLSCCQQLQRCPAAAADAPPLPTTPMLSRCHRLRSPAANNTNVISLPPTTLFRCRRR